MTEQVDSAISKYHSEPSPKDLRIVSLHHLKDTTARLVRKNVPPKSFLKTTITRSLPETAHIDDLPRIVTDSSRITVSSQELPLEESIRVEGTRIPFRTKKVPIMTNSRSLTIEGDNPDLPGETLKINDEGEITYTSSGGVLRGTEVTNATIDVFLAAAETALSRIEDAKKPEPLKAPNISQGSKITSPV